MRQILAALECIMSAETLLSSCDLYVTSSLDSVRHLNSRALQNAKHVFPPQLQPQRPTASWCAVAVGGQSVVASRYTALNMNVLQQAGR